jgi:hypothetical protein
MTGQPRDGHLGSGESIVKPTSKMPVFYLRKGVVPMRKQE